METGYKTKNFTLINSEGKKISLSDLGSSKSVLLLFFPLAFSPVCTDEMCKVRDNMKLYNSLNASVAAISVDSFFTLNEFKKANNLNFALLSDFNKNVSKEFNVLDDDYFGMKGVAKRAAFVIDRNLVIQYSEILEESDSRPDLKAIQIALLKNLRESG